jgi:hypothetical protein
MADLILAAVIGGRGYTLKTLSVLWNTYLIPHSNSVYAVALDRLTGVGHAERMVVDFPAFSGKHEVMPVRIEESDIESARRVWLELLSAWRSDPRAEVNLEFPPHNPEKVEQLVYHELTPTERALVDREFAGAAIGSNTKTH